MINGGMDDSHNADSDGCNTDEGNEKAEKWEEGDGEDGGAEIGESNEEEHDVSKDNDKWWKGESNNACHTHVIHAFLGLHQQLASGLFVSEPPRRLMVLLLKLTAFLLSLNI